MSRDASWVANPFTKFERREEGKRKEWSGREGLLQWLCGMGALGRKGDPGAKPR